MKRIVKILALAAALLLMFAALPAGAGRLGRRDADTTLLAFTSDVHNNTDDIAVDRLVNWIGLVQGIRGDFELMSYCGDMADADLYGEDFWTCAGTVFDAIDYLGVPSIFTTGNHEHKNGYFSTTTNPLTQNYIVDAEGAEGDNYRIYCLGTENFTNEVDNYTVGQAEALTAYLDGVGSEKPIFIITHFPLHSYSSGPYWWSTKRQTVNADLIIDALNDAAESGKTIFFIWGHNHTLSDAYYDHLTLPGTSIPYTTSGSTKTINFYYCAAGCMSDYEYSSGSAFVKGKGLVVELTASGIAMDYYKEDGTAFNGAFVPFEFPVPTEEPTPEPTEEPTPEPTPVPTEEPTPEPTPVPTEEPTPEPTPVPTEEPTPEPTPVPTEEPTPEPTPVPYLYGDVTGDGILSFADISALYTMLIGGEELPEEMMDRADYDRNGIVSFGDVAALSTFLVYG